MIIKLYGIFTIDNNFGVHNVFKFVFNLFHKSKNKPCFLQAKQRFFYLAFGSNAFTFTYIRLHQVLY